MADRVTRARVRRELIELAELSSDDSPYNPSSSEDSSEISFFTDSEGVERVEGYEFDESVDEPQQRVTAPVVATVDLGQFFDRMERHLERQSEIRTTENLENPIL